MEADAPPVGAEYILPLLVREARGRGWSGQRDGRAFGAGGSPKYVC